MDIYRVLEILNIKYKEIKHLPVYTIKEAQNIKSKLTGTGCKNLFLTDKRGNYFLVILEEEKTVNLKTLAQKLRVSRLSFANELDLLGILRLAKGSVTPFGIINDIENKAKLIIDSNLKDKVLLVHPNINTKTIAIKYSDLIKFIEYEEHKYIFI